MRLMVLVASITSLASVFQQEKGDRGIEAARRGGVVIVCRHGITESADENEQTLRYDDPSTQRRLSPDGERQAAEVGSAFRTLQIRVKEVIASPMQRATRTAELAFGTVQRDSAWHTRGENFTGWKYDRRAQALSRPTNDGVRVIISHIGTIYSMLPSIRGELEEGDCVVVRPEGESRYEVIEVVPWRSWGSVAERTK